MFRNTYHKGCLTVFFSGNTDPLGSWGIMKRNGIAKRIRDEDIKSMAMELMGNNPLTTYIFLPRDPKTSLGIKLPVLVLQIKNLHKHFTCQVRIMDDQQITRHFRMSNFQTQTSVKPSHTTLPMALSPGWNQMYFNLADLTRRIYGTRYIEAIRLQIHANARIRRIYFTDGLYSEEELPKEYRLVPLAMKKSLVDKKVGVA